MPLIDFNDTGNSKALNLRSFDCTILGCGAVGIHIALKMARKGRSVLIIESGTLGEQADRQILNDSTYNRPDIGSSVQWGRKRALGGTTIRWGGQALPFQPLDFEPRPWLKCAGWPISFSDLEPFYREAERYMGLSTNGYYGEDLTKLKLKPPFTSETLDYHVSKWAPEPNMFKKHQKELEKNVTVLYNAHCLETIQTGDGQCDGVRLVNFNGLQCIIPVTQLIIATGGVESVRFLLLNQLSESPSLGRGFMEHPCMDLGTVHSSDSAPLQQHFSTRLIHQKKYGIRMSLSKNAQSVQHLSNASASLMFETPDSAFDPMELIRRLAREKKVKDVFILVNNIPHFIRALVAFFRFGIVWKPHAAIRITAMCEQLASDGATLELDSDARDVFGKPKLKVNWKISEKSWKAAQFLASQVKSHLESHCNVEVNLRPELTDSSLPFDSTIFSSVNHHMGGAVMGTDERTSVVDPNLRLHGFSNIWVCSAAVFPTGSHSNPTLTALALGGRLAENESQ